MDRSEYLKLVSEYFYQGEVLGEALTAAYVALESDPARRHKWATLLGLGEKTGIDLPNEVQGLVPSPEWKKAKTGEKVQDGAASRLCQGFEDVHAPIIRRRLYKDNIIE